MRNFLKLYYFIKVVDNNCNMSKTANMLYISRANISKNILDLENLFNNKLFYRKYNKIKLTKFGQDIYNKFYPIYSSYINLMEDYTNKKITIAFPPLIQKAYGFEIINNYIKNFSLNYFKIIEASYIEIKELLGNGEIDICLYDKIIDNDIYTSFIVKKDNYCLISLNHNNNKYVKLEEITNKKIITLNNNISVYYELINYFKNIKEDFSFYTTSYILEYLLNILECENDTLLLSPKSLINVINTKSYNINEIIPSFNWNIYLIFKKSILKNPRFSNMYIKKKY
ncbi:MAG: LysR family transcriptional regulator [Methanobrevibacter sp.]|jgi:hypothetical protein|nr:LysR family transcriptional regulator [Candidatus Methanovirga australis]